ncbi:acetolactate synthase catalytic subunit [Klebsiella pneumoniae]|nr:acetolactate synthase catalytic subunit [Klebsiella pneumoniae]
MKLPVLVVVGNNGGWGAVAGGTKALYPDGYAARAETIPATAFTTSPDFAAIAASSRAAALSVSRAERSPRRAGRSGIPHTHPPTKRAG